MPGLQEAADHDVEALTHAHDSLATDPGRRSALEAALGLIFLVFVAELVGGFLSNSLALFSDAGHVFMDLFSYALALAAVRLAQNPSSERSTFGHHRSEIVAAFLNGLLLLLVAAIILLEGWRRLGTEDKPDTTIMLIVPSFAIMVNLYLATRLRSHHDLNIKGAYLHVLADLASALGVFFAGVLILATGNPIFDPLASFLIAFLIVLGAWKLIRETADILLEKTPAHIVVADVISSVEQVPGVRGVHSVHIWSLCSTVHAMSAHILTGPGSIGESERILKDVRARVSREYSIALSTFQVECEDCGAGRHPPSVPHGPSDMRQGAHA